MFFASGRQCGLERARKDKSTLSGSDYIHRRGDKGGCGGDGDNGVSAKGSICPTSLFAGVR